MTSIQSRKTYLIPLLLTLSGGVYADDENKQKNDCFSCLDDQTVVGIDSIVVSDTASGLDIGADEIVVDETIDIDDALVQKGSPFFMGNLIPADASFPRTFGIGLVGSNMDMTWDVADVDFDTSDNSLQLPNNESVILATQTQGIRADMWLLPFLNVFATYQNVDQDVTLSGVYDTLLEKYGTTQFSLDGDTLAGGVVLASGWGRFFAELNVVYANTNLDNAYDITLRSKAWIYQPRLGYNFKNVSIWLGAEMIDTKSVYSATKTGFSYQTPELNPGTISDTIGVCSENGIASGRCAIAIGNTEKPSLDMTEVQTDVTGTVSLDKPQWSGLLGMHSYLAQNVEASIEIYFGDRVGGNATVSYRFQ